MGFKSVLFSFAMVLASFNTSASIIFNFSIDDVSTFGITTNTTVGDSFSFSFYDDSSFASGISSADIESVSFNTAFLGTGIINAPFFQIITANLQEIFNFTFSGGKWNLDLLVGVTGNDAGIVFRELTGDVRFQLGQTISGGGATNFSIRTPNGDSQILHSFQRSNTFSAVAVTEPTTTAMLFLLLSGLFVRSMKTRK